MQTANKDDKTGSRGIASHETVSKFVQAAEMRCFERDLSPSMKRGMIEDGEATAT